MLDTKILELRQTKYEKKLEKDNFAIAAGAAFVRSIQSIGYKNSASAMGDLLDNAIEANANKILIHIEGDKNVPDKITIMDNGNGMRPALMRKAATWGGTDREGSAEGLGRFGFGLPSASMSQGHKFQVISAKKGEPFMMVEFDLHAAERGEYDDPNGIMQMPEPIPYDLPKEMTELRKKFLGNANNGTMVVLYPAKDQLSHKSINGLADHYKRELGTICYRFLTDRDLYVVRSNEKLDRPEDALVRPIDPSFVDPNSLYYDMGGLRSKPHKVGILKEVLNPKTLEKGDIRIHVVYLGPNFHRVDCDSFPHKGNKNLNARYSISRDWNGFVIMRNGRIIDCVTHLQKHVWENRPGAGKAITTLLNNDVHWRVMIDFDAELDGMFNVETTKQRAIPNDVIWTKIYESGLLFPHMSQFRKDYLQEAALIDEAKSKAEISEAGMTPGEKALTEASKFANQDTLIKEALEDKGEKNVRNEAIKSIEDKQELPTEELISQEVENLLPKTNQKAKVKLVSVTGGNFVMYKLFGPILIVEINQEHEFYSLMYAHPRTSTYMKEALKVLLGSIGWRTQITEENVDFYNRELRNISDTLAIGLKDMGSSTIPDGNEDLDSKNNLKSVSDTTEVTQKSLEPKESSKKAKKTS